MKYLTLVAASPTGIIGDVGNEIVASLLAIQNTLLVSPLFVEMNNIGAYIAISFSILFAAKLYLEAESGNKDKVIRMFIAALIAVYFHANNGLELANYIKTNIALQNTITDGAAQKLIRGRTIGQAKSDTTGQNQANAQAQAAFNACYSRQQTDSTYDIKGCLNNAKAGLSAAARIEFDKVVQQNGQNLGWDPTGGLANSLLDGIKSFVLEMLSAVELAIRVFAQVTQIIFSLFAPLAVGAVFIPGIQGAIVIWTINFWKIWLFRFSMVMLSGLISMVFENSNNAIVSLVVGICIAFLSPWLSFIVATGSGTAIMQGLTSGAASGAAGTIGGAATAAKFVASKIGAK